MSALLCVRELFGGVSGREFGRRLPRRSESEARGLDSDDLGGLGEGAEEFPYIQRLDDYSIRIIVGKL